MSEKHRPKEGDVFTASDLIEVLAKMPATAKVFVVSGCCGGMARLVELDRDGDVCIDSD